MWIIIIITQQTIDNELLTKQLNDKIKELQNIEELKLIELEKQNQIIINKNNQINNKFQFVKCIINWFKSLFRLK